MVPVQGLTLEEEVGDDAEDNQRDDFLDYLELHEGKRAAVADKADAVGWYLTAVLEEGDAPGEGNDTEKGPV